MHKVLIRPLRFEDASVSWKWRNDPEVWKHTGSRPNIVITEEIEKQWVLEKLEEHNSARFAIEVDDVYVGNIQLTNIVEKETAEYHVFIGDKSYWGKGVASLATAQIIRYAKNLLNLQSLYLHVRPENISAIKVYEKSGFVKINDDVKMTLDLLKAKIPLVSVFMMAYNHEKYISEAIDGVLMQKTNFDFDIVIGEDCSTDNTRQIILDYQKKYPGKFKLLLHENNIGAIANQLDVFSSCTGKYIAMCEGDDYWTDPYKLQKQVDFLEANEDYVICFHNVQIKLEKEGRFVDDFITHDVPDTTDINDLLNENYIHTPSVLLRRNEQTIYDFQSMPPIPMGDYPLYLMTARYGKIKKLSEIMAVYRYGVGIWTAENVIKDSIINNFMIYNALIGKFSDDINKILLSRFRSAFKSIFNVDYYLVNKNKIDEYLSKNVINDTETLSMSLFKSEVNDREMKSIKKTAKRLFKLLLSRTKSH